MLLPAIAFPQDYSAIDTLREAVVTAPLRDIVKKTQMGLSRISGLEIENGLKVFGTPDIIKSIQNQPGIASGVEMFSGMYVRGGDGSDNLFVLDGIPLYQVTHLGGLFTSFNTQIMEKTDFYKSDFPAVYGGRLSSVVEVVTRSGDMFGYHGQVSLGLLDGRIQAEGPIVPGRLSYNVALRRSWADLLAGPILNEYNRGKRDKRDGTYKMSDIFANLTYSISSSDKFSVKVYSSRDRFAYERKFENPVIQENDGVQFGGENVAAGWSNLLLYVKYEKSFSDNLFGETTVYHLMSPAETSWGDWAKESHDEDAGTREHQEKNNSEISDTGILASINAMFADRHYASVGIQGINHTYAPESLSFREENGTVSDSGFEDRKNAAEWVVFAEDELIYPRWQFKFGGRLVGFSTDGVWFCRFEPRLSIAATITDRLVFKASFTRMSQFSHLVSANYLDLPTNLWMPSSSSVPPLAASQFSSGLYYSAGSLEVRSELFYKTMTHLRQYAGRNAVFPSLEHWDAQSFMGEGRAYGLELTARKKRGDINLEVDYTLGWTQRRFDAIYDGWFYDHYDSRHKVTLSCEWKISERVGLYTQWNYHTGYRETRPDHYEASSRSLLYGEPYNAKMPDYHRLDAGINLDGKAKGRCQGTWNFSIYNVYCRLNPVYTYIELGDDGKYHAYAFGMIPIIPSVSYTLRF